MGAWELRTIEAAQAAAGTRYLEFFRVPDLSAGLYVLEPGEPDPQSPQEPPRSVAVSSTRLPHAPPLRVSRRAAPEWGTAHCARPVRI